jgi:small subunit ribosomal protein S20
MPNLKSAKKRMRQTVTRTARNASVRTRIRTARRAFFEAAEQGDKEASEAAFRSYCSVLDKAAKTRLIKRNNAIRRKNRAAARLRALAS